MKSRLRAALRRSRSASAAATTRLIGPAERRAAEAWRADVAARGTDQTGALVGDPRPLLVVAPHPDDETIGCAVLMARRADAGLPVTVVVVSDGETSHRSALLPPDELAARRREESRTACGLLGVGDVRFLGFGEQALREEPGGLVSELATLV
ncbi:MAG: hypothetical protein QOC55_2419, partial [Thermoleophilaceae bacterium]|nr:hypothetical protein [Thermoleophilaceae bacterium]